MQGPRESQSRGAVPASDQEVGGERQESARVGQHLSVSWLGTAREKVFQVPQDAFILLSKNICPYTST